MFLNLLFETLVARSKHSVIQSKRSNEMKVNRMQASKYEMDFFEKGITSFHSDNSVVTRHSCRDKFEKGMNFNYDSFLFCTLLMLICVNFVFNAK